MRLGLEGGKNKFLMAFNIELLFLGLKSFLKAQVPCTLQTLRARIIT